MKNGKYVISIVGCGGMGAGHAYSISGQNGKSELQSRLVLGGVYDIASERMEWAAEQGFHLYQSYEDMLRDSQTDIILIATPNHLHKEMTLSAFAAGKHVLCEKPVMVSSSELVEIIEASRTHGRVFYPRQNRRWDKDYLIIRQLFEQRTLGKTFHIESRVVGSRGIPGDWRGKKEYGGGMMLDWGVHLLDRLLEMVPERVKTVFCHMTHVSNPEVDDGFRMHMTFESGLTAVTEVGTCHFVAKPLWYMAGDKGTVQIDNWDCDGTLALLTSWDDKDAKPILAGEGLTKTMAPRAENSVKLYPLPDMTPDSDMLYLNLLDVIENKAPQLVTPEQALRVMRLMEAAILSDATGQTVEFE